MWKRSLGPSSVCIWTRIGRYEIWTSRFDGEQYCYSFHLQLPPPGAIKLGVWRQSLSPRHPHDTPLQLLRQELPQNFTCWMHVRATSIGSSGATSTVLSMVPGIYGSGELHASAAVHPGKHCSMSLWLLYELDTLRNRTGLVQEDVRFEVITAVTVKMLWRRGVW
jgi:hypothetical protein